MNTRNYKFVTLAALVFLFFNMNATAQVGIGTLTPNTNAMLDVESTSKGFLPPRMDTTQKTTLGGLISTGEAGMLIFDTDLGSYAFWDGAAWVSIGATASLGNLYVTVPDITTTTAAGIKIMTSGTSIINSTDFDDDGGEFNRLRYIGADSKVFAVNASVTFTRIISTASQDIFDFYVSKNGSTAEEFGVLAQMSAPIVIGGPDDLYDVSLTGTVSLVNGDYIEVFARSASGSTIAVTTMNIVLEEK